MNTAQVKYEEVTMYIFPLTLKSLRLFKFLHPQEPRAVSGYEEKSKRLGKKIGAEMLERKRGGPGERLLPAQFQTVLWMRGQKKILCIFLPNKQETDTHCVF